jgi:CHRD domain-containing protein
VRKLVTALALCPLASLVVTAAAAAGPAAERYRVSATLTPGQEVPAQAVNAQSAHGTFTATLTGTTLRWKLTFAKLTGPATAAHIHLGGMGKTGAPAVHLCEPCTSGMTGTSTVSAGLLRKMEKHGTYVNLHTARNQPGEIRGQIVVKSGA